MAGRDVPKIDPVEVARASLDGIRVGSAEVLVDEPSRIVKAMLSAPLGVLPDSADAR